MNFRTNSTYIIQNNKSSFQYNLKNVKYLMSSPTSIINKNYQYQPNCLMKYISRHLRIIITIIWN